MAALADNIGVLFRIKADPSNALKGIAATKLGIKGFVDDAEKVGVSFGSVAIGAGVAAAAVVTVGTAVVVAAAQLFNFTKQAAEFTSKLYDASIQTGLSAASISALKLAADSSGSSLEAVSGAVSKLNVLVGSAANGNEKAQKTLEQYGITAKTTNEAFNQAISVIGGMTDQTQKAAAMQALFKDRTGQLSGVIDQVNGDFKEYIETCRKLGVVLTEEDLKAADEFGDTLEALGTQAKIAGVKFASEMMPDITRAMAAISRAMADNKDVAREWGNFVVNTATGVAFVMQTVGGTINNVLSAISLGLINQQNAWSVWAGAARVAIAVVSGGLSEIIWALNKVGEYLNGQKQKSIADLRMGDDTNTRPNKTFAIPSGGGGKGGGGGKSAADEAEQARQKELQAAERVMRQKLELFKKASDEQEKILDAQLSRQEISEMEHLERVRQLKENEARYELLLLKQHSRNKLLNDKEREEVVHRTTIAETQARIEQLNTQIAINKQDEKHLEFLRKAKKALEELMEKERQRLRDRRNAAANSLLQEKIAAKERANEEKRSMQRLDGRGGAWEELFKGLQGDNQFKNNGALIAGIEVLRSAFEGLGQAIGQVVNAWVLYGSAGQSVRQVTAQILASIAQQAAVKAIFELAEGFAALALAFFGLPNAGPSANAHFAAAAIYGSIAGVAALAGRAVAGDSFRQTTGAATGQGSGQGGREDRNYTTGFGGFRNEENPVSRVLRENLTGENAPFARLLLRLNSTLGQVEETVHDFKNTFSVATPGDVVMAGAEHASGAIRSAYEGEIGGDSRATDALMRGTGQAR